MNGLRIALIQTGGTIGGTDGNVMALPRGESALRQRLSNLYRRENITFDVFNPVSVFSEDIGGDTLMRILKTVVKTAGGNYDGIIVTHGSDTVHYTAAAVSALLPDIGIPLVFTCSLIPAARRGTDAFDNLRLAVCAIKQCIAGVWLAFQNGSHKLLINGSRVTPCTVYGEFVDYFGTPSYIFSGGRFNKNPNFKEMPVCPAASLPDKFANILFIRPYPLQNYDCFSIDTLDAVLHAGYHSGTACTSGDAESIVGLIRRCRAASVPFFFCTPVPAENPYPSTVKILRSGAVAITGVSPYFAYMRLLMKEPPNSPAPPENAVNP